jgi:uncharacterized protein YigA (DUF484 family)
MQPAVEPDATPAFVESWLRAHPGFLAERPELYALLDPPARIHGDRLADHMQARIAAGQAREAALARQIEALLAAGRANMAASGRIQRAVLALLAAADVLAVLPTLADLLGIEAVSLCAERPAPPGFRTLPEGEVARLLPPGRDVVLRAAPPEAVMLHGEAHPLVASDALLRLEGVAGGRPALLCLGAREAETFQPGQATDLLQFLAAAVAAALGRR